MSSSAREQFIEAGMHLYPQYGYRQLSVRLLAAETGLSSGMFHHLFASKADFVAELLESQNADTFGRLDFRTDEHASAVAKLRHAVCLLAGGVRDNLAWINRIFADSADGVETADTFLRQQFDRYSAWLYQLLGECFPQMPLSDLVVRMSYLCSSVVAPMFLSIRLNNMGILLEEVSSHVPAVLSDEALEQRIDWTFAALFPDYSAQDKP